MRRIAQSVVGLRVADKKDSQDICFVSSGDHADFVQRRIAGQGDGKDRGGEIVTTDGTVVGRHDGIERFTIGQRKGLGVALGDPRYVVRLDLAKRQVVIGTHDELGRQEFFARQCIWLADELTTSKLHCFACASRYNSRPALAVIDTLPGGADYTPVLDEPGFGGARRRVRRSCVMKTIASSAAAGLSDGFCRSGVSPV